MALPDGRWSVGTGRRRDALAVGWVACAGRRRYRWRQMKREGGMRRWALAWLCLMAAGAWGQAVDATHWQSGGWRAQDGDDMAGADSPAIWRWGGFFVCSSIGR